MNRIDRVVLSVGLLLLSIAGLTMIIDPSNVKNSKRLIPSTLPSELVEESLCITRDALMEHLINDHNYSHTQALVVSNTYMKFYPIEEKGE